MPIRVLLVDGHALLRDALLTFLDAEDGIEVVGQAADGNEALAEAARVAPDVVLMEASLPALDGIAATRAMAQAAPQAKVLLLAAQAAPDRVAQALQAGARGYLSKHSRAAELARAVRAVAAGERYLGSGVAEPPAQAAGGPLGLLTDTERRILKLTAEGKSNVEMAQMLSLSHRTVETYRLIMMRKLGIRGLPALVKLAIRQGLATLD